jgi:hypothetical protein
MVGLFNETGDLAVRGAYRDTMAFLSSKRRWNAPGRWADARLCVRAWRPVAEHEGTARRVGGREGAWCRLEGIERTDVAV